MRRQGRCGRDSLRATGQMHEEKRKGRKRKRVKKAEEDERGGMWWEEWPGYGREKGERGKMSDGEKGEKRANRESMFVRDNKQGEGRKKKKGETAGVGAVGLHPEKAGVGAVGLHPEEARCGAGDRWDEKVRAEEGEEDGMRGGDPAQSAPVRRRDGRRVKRGEGGTRAKRAGRGRGRGEAEAGVDRVEAARRRTAELRFERRRETPPGRRDAAATPAGR